MTKGIVSKTFFKKQVPAFTIGGLCLLLTVVLSGAAFASPRLQDTQGLATTPTPTMPMNQIMSQSSTVQLTHVATGVAQLTVKNGTLIVVLKLQGLAPKSSHVAHIHSGKGGCLAMGNDPVLHPLTPIVAGANGQGTSTTTIPGVQNIPASGWYVNVHNGGNGLRPADQQAVISCAPIQNPHHTASIIANLGPSSSPSENASGTVKLILSANAMNGQKMLNVAITLNGLAPGTKHAAHIHMGTCARQAEMLYSIGDLVAGRNGTVTAREMIPVGALASIPASGWIVNVHYGAMADLVTQTGYSPILCGSVTPAKA